MHITPGKWAGVLLIAALAACKQSPQETTQGPTPRASAIEAHMAFLADDLLEGREAGTRGYAIAARYVASQFRALGLEPAGDESGYFQAVPMRESTLVADSVTFQITGPVGTQALANGEDVGIRADPMASEQDIEAAVVFAGRGIEAAEWGYDDYADLDVSGKIVAVLGGVPADMPSEMAAHFGSAAQQRKTAAVHGAIGVLVLYTPTLEARFAFALWNKLVHEPVFTWRAADGPVQVDAPSIRVRAWLAPGAAKALFAGADKDFDTVLAEATSGHTRGFPLNTRVRLARRTTHKDTSSPNVAALLPGSDPALADEVVLLIAHLDHVGIGKPEKGDAIYNGALDNAAGSAALLEVARSLALAPTRPKRSILFLATTAEEKGLVGSDYFAHHPSVAISRIVAAVNLDGGLPFYDFTDVIAFGAEHSTLGQTLAETTREMGLKVAPDPFPEQSIFVRSDHYSLVKMGVPSVFLFMGFGSADGPNTGRKYWDWAMANHYHRPTDDMDQLVVGRPIDFAVQAKFADVYRRLARRIADTPDRPQWLEGDFFGDTFAPEAARAPTKD